MGKSFLTIVVLVLSFCLLLPLSVLASETGEKEKATTRTPRQIFFDLDHYWEMAKLDWKNPEHKKHWEEGFSNLWNKLSKEEKVKVLLVGISAAGQLTDKHTKYLSNLANQYPYEGLGIVLGSDIDNNKTQVVVTGVFRNSPAKIHNIKPGDKVLAVNIKWVSGINVSSLKHEFKKHARAQEGAAITVGLIKNSSGPITLTLNRNGKEIIVRLEKAKIGEDIAPQLCCAIKTWKWMVPKLKSGLTEIEQALSKVEENKLINCFIQVYNIKTAGHEKYQQMRKIIDSHIDSGK